ncbi:hypothetical protein M413DRAFT_337997 [Hebeloma cylindrosporum]|uniref:Uncharacterized protein n=1 Tax=Hebeloma cylindrosporum TaxID=76867 RepID=A0A0C2Y643_HEBCY|nr:hypothetical protein M413DRAFT_337997 [Hebeloma cylindrosporum h7]
MYIQCRNFVMIRFIEISTLPHMSVNVIVRLIIALKRGTKDPSTLEFGRRTCMVCTALCVSTKLNESTMQTPR